MENTINYLMMYQSAIVNITQVEIMPYSDDELVTPGMATLTGIDSGTLEDTKGTTFNILQDFTLQMDEMLFDNSDIPDGEKSEIEISPYIILAHRSSLTIDNMMFRSDYSTLIGDKIFILGINIGEGMVKLTNQDWSINGQNFYTTTNLNLHIENITVDFYKSLGGFDRNIDCNYPEAVHDVLTYSKNMTFYFSEERQTARFSYNPFKGQGSGQFVVEDFTSSLYFFFTDIQ